MSLAKSLRKTYEDKNPILAEMKCAADRAEGNLIIDRELTKEEQTFFRKKGLFVAQSSGRFCIYEGKEYEVGHVFHWCTQTCLDWSGSKKPCANLPIDEGSWIESYRKHEHSE